MGRGGERGPVRAVRHWGKVVDVAGPAPALLRERERERECVCVCVKLQTLLSGLEEILETASEVLRPVLYHGNLRDLF